MGTFTIRKRIAFMLRSNQHTINFLLFIIISLFIIIYAITVFPVLLLYYAGIILTLLLIIKLNKNTKELRDTLSIFLSTFLFGLILALMVNNDFIMTNTIFLYPDQLTFYETATIMSFENSIGDVIRMSLLGDYGEYKMVYAIFGGLAYVDRFISGAVNFFPLLLSVVYITALIPVFLYHILKLYLPLDLSLKGSVFYGLLTPIMAYSGYLLRDMHISLITIIAFFLIVREIRLDRLIGLVLLMLIMSGFRLANMLLILAMILVYLFAGKASKSIKLIFIVISIGTFLFFIDQFLNILESTQGRLEGYVEFTQHAVDESAGFGRLLYRFPPVIKEISIILFTLSAFPFWSIISAAETTPQYIMGLYSFVTNIGWFFIFVGVLLFIKPLLQNVFRENQKILFYLFLLSLIYLFVSTSNMTFRRIICILPFIYVPFLLIYYKLNTKQKHFYYKIAWSTGIFISVMYIFLII